jgi:hypothetical protein
VFCLQIFVLIVFFFSLICDFQQPLFMWLSIQKKGTAGFEIDARVCIERAQHLFKRLKDAGIEVDDGGGLLAFCCLMGQIRCQGFAQ